MKPSNPNFSHDLGSWVNMPELWPFASSNTKLYHLCCILYHTPVFLPVLTIFAMLLQPKWNDALLEMFRIDYVGSSPYITCNPSLFHHRLSTRDRFLILSSDGLYQYFTNEEAVAQVEMFIATTPEGDPAQHLVEEVLFRAANKAGILKSYRVCLVVVVQ